MITQTQAITPAGANPSLQPTPLVGMDAHSRKIELCLTRWQHGSEPVVLKRLTTTLDKTRDRPQIGQKQDKNKGQTRMALTSDFLTSGGFRGVFPETGLALFRPISCTENVRRPAADLTRRGVRDHSRRSRDAPEWRLAGTASPHLASRADPAQRPRRER